MQWTSRKNGAEGVSAFWCVEISENVCQIFERALLMSSECVSCSRGRFKDCISVQQDTRQDKSLSKRLRTQTHVCTCVCTKFGKCVTGLCKGYVRGFHERCHKNTSEKCLRDCVREVYL